MSVENVKKLELGVEMSCGLGTFEKVDTLMEKDLQKLIDNGLQLEEDAMKSGDIDVLERAFDYFLEEDPDNGLGNGGCEGLIREIFEYFTWEQILSILDKKLGNLMESNISRAVQFFGACLNTGHFENARKMFNRAKFAKSKEFLAEFTDWYGDDYPQEIAILRKDMEKWK